MRWHLQLGKLSRYSKPFPNLKTKTNQGKEKLEKKWDELCPRHKRRKIREIKESATLALNDEHFEVTGLQMRNKNTGNTSLIQVLEDATCSRPDKENEIHHLNQVLYTKDKYGISDAAYHELTQSDSLLPRTCQVKKRITEMNCECDVYPTPEGTTGVQQSLRKKLVRRIEHLVETSLED